MGASSEPEDGSLPRAEQLTTVVPGIDIIIDETQMHEDEEPQHTDLAVTTGDRAAIGEVDVEEPEVRIFALESNESWLLEPEIILPTLQTLERWFVLLKTMMVHSAARNDPGARAIEDWARKPCAFVEAQGPRRREAALRYWYARFNVEFPNADVKLWHIRRQYLSWLQARRDLKRDLLLPIITLVRSTRLPATEVSRIAGYLQPGADEWSTGSVTGLWQRILNYLSRM